jgi:hypothetical protein
MKKNLLLLLFILTYVSVSAQVVFNVQPPSDLAGNYDMTYLLPQWWPNVPDMEDPANAVIAELAMALDNTAADSLVGSPVVSDVDGKIAVIYRGSYSFAGKIWRAQEAGAVAVVMISNDDTDALITMSATGDTAEWVTIPAVLVSYSTGATLRDEIIAGGLEALIGNKVGFFENDLTIRASYVVKAEQSSSVQLLSQDETEFAVEAGTWVRNEGSNDQTNIIVNGSIDFDGGNIYSESSAPFDLFAGDSVFVPLPTFEQSTYDLGTYTMVYSASSDSTDDFVSDNSLNADFYMTQNKFAYASFTDGEANNSSFFQPGEISGEVQQCIAFKDPNASRVAVTGLDFAMSTNGESMDGEVIDLRIYEWALEFEDLNDSINYTGINFDDFDLIAEGTYEYIGDDFENQNVFGAFDEPYVLDDDARYLFCIAYSSTELFSGFDNSDKIDYQTTQDVYLQPMFPNTAGEIDASNEEIWFLNGYGTDIVPTIVANMVDANALSVNELTKTIDVTPYPNPARDFIQIPMVDVTGLTTIQIFDVAGKLVETQNYNTTAGTNLRVDVSNLEAGVYTFGLRYESGNVSNFNVVITK